MFSKELKLAALIQSKRSPIKKAQIINELRREMNVPLFVLLDIAEISSSSYYDACQREYKVDDQEVISDD